MARTKGDLVRRSLRALIDDASPGDRLPPERELMQRFDVARETLRRAIEALAADGLLERRQGAGTFVTQPKITSQFQVRSFTEDMRARRMSSSSRVLGSSSGPAGARTGSALGISPGEAVVTITRLRLADDEPMALERLNIPTSLVPGLDVAALESASLYETLKREYGIMIASGHQTIEATVTDPEDSELLGVPPLSPALLIDRVTWTGDGRRVESVRSIYRGDRYKFEVGLHGSRQEPEEGS